MLRSASRESQIITFEFGFRMIPSLAEVLIRQIMRVSALIGRSGVCGKILACPLANALTSTHLFTVNLIVFFPKLFSFPFDIQQNTIPIMKHSARCGTENGSQRSKLHAARLAQTKQSESANESAVSEAQAADEPRPRFCDRGNVYHSVFPVIQGSSSPGSGW